MQRVPAHVKGLTVVVCLIAAGFGATMAARGAGATSKIR